MLGASTFPDPAATSQHPCCSLLAPLPNRWKGRQAPPEGRMRVLSQEPDGGFCHSVGSSLHRRMADDCATCYAAFSKEKPHLYNAGCALQRAPAAFGEMLPLTGAAQTSEPASPRPALFSSGAQKLCKSVCLWGGISGSP